VREAEELGLGSLLVKPNSVDELGQVLHQVIAKSTRHVR
jgi:YesN/AraC family two-component response regulator